jgi:ADP-ribose pyrophosphatase
VRAKKNDVLGAGPRIATRRVYTGKVLNLDIDTVRFPGGSHGELEMIRHPGASAVVPFLSDPGVNDPEILLLRQYRYAAEQYLYEIPAGRLEAGEQPETCARRELTEETGCTAERMEHLFTFFTTPGFTNERIHAFLATGLTRGKAKHESDEFIEVVTHPLSEVLSLLRRGEIRDAKTALSLLFVVNFWLRA